MKYILRFIDKHFYLAMAILATLGFIGGMVIAHYSVDSIEKRHEAAVAAGVFDVCKVEAAELDVVETEQPEATRTYFDVPLSEDLQNYIFYLCEENGIDPAIIVAMCFRESNYDASDIGDGGNSFGLMQIQKRHHLERMERLGVTNLLDPYGNISVGVDFFAELLGKYDGNVLMALTAYNCGASGAYNNYFSKGVYANNYAKRVMETCQDLQSK